MFIDYLKRIAIAYPDHPLAKQELTVTFTCWVAHVQDEIGHLLTFTWPPSPRHLDILWQEWQEYQARANATPSNNTHPIPPGS